jgi:hypothetical protein
VDPRDWELLDKQLGSDPSRRNDGVTVLTAVAVFFSGMMRYVVRAGEPAHASRIEPCDGCDGM